MAKIVKHTPGPWKVSDPKKLDRDLWPFGGIEGINGHMVASVSRTGPKGVANARLIAAAPTLLAKLEYVVRRIDKASGSPTFTALQVSFLEDLIREVKGEES